MSPQERVVALPSSQTWRLSQPLCHEAGVGLEGAVTQGSVPLRLEPLFEEAILLLLLREALSLLLLDKVRILLEVENFQNISDELGLDRFICGALHTEGRGSVHFKQPRLPLSVHKNIESQKFKSAFIILGRRAELDQSQKNDLLDSFPENIVIKISRLKIILQLLESPLNSCSSYSSDTSLYNYSPNLPLNFSYLHIY